MEAFDKIESTRVPGVVGKEIDQLLFERRNCILNLCIANIAWAVYVWSWEDGNIGGYMRIEEHDHVESWSCCSLALRNDESNSIWFRFRDKEETK